MNQTLLVKLSEESTRGRFTLGGDRFNLRSSFGRSFGSSSFSPSETDTAGLVSKINRSTILPLPTTYYSSIKRLIKSMLRKSPEHRPTAAELLRHPHLQPYVARYSNLSPVFLPVKSELILISKPKVELPNNRKGRKKESDDHIPQVEKNVNRCKIINSAGSSSGSSTLTDQHVDAEQK